MSETKISVEEELQDSYKNLDLLSPITKGNPDLVKAIGGVSKPHDGK